MKIYDAKDVTITLTDADGHVYKFEGADLSPVVARDSEGRRKRTRKERRARGRKARAS